jgi:hypothetical protein
MTTTTPAKLANIPHPAGAVEVCPWCDTGSYFQGGSWVVERNTKDDDFSVQIDGTQYADGRVKRFIMVAEGNTEALIELTRDHARQLGEALIAAADELETMASYDQVVVR